MNNKRQWVRARALDRVSPSSRATRAGHHARDGIVVIVIVAIGFPRKMKMRAERSREPRTARAIGVSRCA